MGETAEADILKPGETKQIRLHGEYMFFFSFFFSLFIFLNNLGAVTEIPICDGNRSQVHNLGLNVKRY